MLVVPGREGKDLCDSHLGMTRRAVLRVGGSGLFGMTLGSMFRLQAANAAAGTHGGAGWGKAKSVVMVYLQGGPSHIDLWDPKENVPDKVRSAFKNIPTKIPGTQFTEILPKLAQVNDKFTMIRSMGYTPVGLFNHTAAIYQMMTGYTTDKVSPSGQLEPPTPKDFPNFGSNIIRLKPSEVPMLPFVMLPRPLQESNVVGKAGTAGFLGRDYDPYTLYPDGDDMDMAKMEKVRVDDLKLRPEVFASRLERRAKLQFAGFEIRTHRVARGELRDDLHVGVEIEQTVEDRQGGFVTARIGGEGAARGIERQDRGALAEGDRAGRGLRLRAQAEARRAHDGSRTGGGEEVPAFHVASP